MSIKVLQPPMSPVSLDGMNIVNVTDGETLSNEKYALVAGDHCIIRLSNNVYFYKYKDETHYIYYHSLTQAGSAWSMQVMEIRKSTQKISLSSSTNNQIIPNIANAGPNDAWLGNSNIGGTKYLVLNPTTNIASKYSASSTYAEGDYAFYGDQLYKCTTAITTAEAWNSAHWTAVKITDELGSGGGGPEIVELSAVSGTLTDEQYNKLAGDNAIMVLPGGGRYRKQNEDSTTITYVLNNATGTTGYFFVETITKSTKAYRSSYNTIQNVVINGNWTPRSNANKIRVGGSDYWLFNPDNITGEFSNATTYNVGDYVIYQGQLYKCIEAIETAGDWDSTKWTSTNVCSQLANAGSSGVTSLGGATGAITLGTGLSIANNVLSASTGLEKIELNSTTGTLTAEQLAKAAVGAVYFVYQNVEFIFTGYAHADLPNPRWVYQEMVDPSYHSYTNKYQFWARKCYIDSVTGGWSFDENLSVAIDKMIPNATVPSGTTPTEVTGFKLGQDYYSIPSGGGGGGPDVVTISSSSGTLSDDDYTKVAGDNCIMKYNDIEYHKYKDSSSQIEYVANDNASVQHIDSRKIQITKSTKAYQYYQIMAYYMEAGDIQFNPTLPGSEVELTGVKSGYYYYKAFAASQVAPAYDATATYEIGQIVSYKGKTYICLDNITTAEAWDDNHWSETNAGPQIVNLGSAISGTLTDLDFAKCFADNCIIYLNNKSYYNKISFSRTNKSLTYVLTEWSGGYDRMVILYNMSIFIRYITATSTKKYDWYNDNGGKTLNVVDANPNNNNGDNLTGLQVGPTKYKVFNPVNVAPTYSSSSTYDVGDLVTYKGDLYKCNTAISTAEAWTAAHWTATDVASNLGGGGGSEATIEIVTAQGGQTLTAAQLAKIPLGKLYLKYPYGNEIVTQPYYEDSSKYMYRFQSAGANEGDASTSFGYSTTITNYVFEVNKSTGAITQNSFQMIRSPGSDSCISETTTPEYIRSGYIAGRKVIREGNLRRTQDMICPDYYDSTATYSVGDMVIYQNILYKCNTAITVAEEWDSTHWTQTSITAELANAGGSSSPVAYEGTIGLPEGITVDNWALHRCIKDGNILWLTWVGSITRTTSDVNIENNTVFFSCTLPSEIASHIYRKDGTTCDQASSTSTVVIESSVYFAGSQKWYKITSDSANTIALKANGPWNPSIGAQYGLDIRIPIFLDIGTVAS